MKKKDLHSLTRIKEINISNQQVGNQIVGSKLKNRFEAEYYVISLFYSNNIILLFLDPFSYGISVAYIQ